MENKAKVTRATRRVGNSFKKILYRTIPKKDDKKLFWAAHQVITPFSGFIISNFYLSEEIDFHNLGWLNSKAKRMTYGRLQRRTSPAILYCQADQITNFIENFLPHIEFPFSLITGKWHLPSLKQQTIFQSLLSNKWLVEWYSQNQVIEDLPIQPFPYGVSIETVVTFAELQIEDSQREPNPLIPFSTIHPHMSLEDRRFREQLSKKMQPNKPFVEYLSDLKSHKYVVCTPGDRPDTYRHWESIACGAIPIILQGQNFQALFKDSAVYSDDFSDISHAYLQTNVARNRKEIATVCYWKHKVEKALLN